MSSTSSPTVTISPSQSSASASADGTTASVGPTQTTPTTIPLYVVYQKFTYDARYQPMGVYDNMDDAKQGLQNAVINGGALSIYQYNVIDRTNG